MAEDYDGAFLIDMLRQYQNLKLYGGGEYQRRMFLSGDTSSAPNDVGFARILKKQTLFSARGLQYCVRWIRFSSQWSLVCVPRSRQGWM